MTRGPAVQGAGGSFDAFAVARRGAVLAGTVDASTLARVADRLAAGPAAIGWRISGAADALGRPALEVAVDGTVPLECQSCLRKFSWPVAQRTLLLLARDERELRRLDEDDEHEVILGPSLDALALIEDELLLTLPFAPRCDRSDCAKRTAAMAGRAVEGAATPSSFDALASIRTGQTPNPERRDIKAGPESDDR